MTAMSREQLKAYVEALHREARDQEALGNTGGVQEIHAELRRVEGEPDPRKRAQRRPRQSPNRQERRS